MGADDDAPPTAAGDGPPAVAGSGHPSQEGCAEGEETGPETTRTELTELTDGEEEEEEEDEEVAEDTTDDEDLGFLLGLLEPPDALGGEDLLIALEAVAKSCKGSLTSGVAEDVEAVVTVVFDPEVLHVANLEKVYALHAPGHDHKERSKQDAEVAECCLGILSLLARCVHAAGHTDEAGLKQLAALPSRVLLRTVTPVPGGAAGAPAGVLKLNEQCVKHACAALAHLTPLSSHFVVSGVFQAANQMLCLPAVVASHDAGMMGGLLLFLSSVIAGDASGKTLEAFVARTTFESFCDMFAMETTSYQGFRSAVEGGDVNGAVGFTRIVHMVAGVTAPALPEAFRGASLTHWLLRTAHAQACAVGKKDFYELNGWREADSLAAVSTAYATLAIVSGSDMCAQVTDPGAAIASVCRVVLHDNFVVAQRDLATAFVKGTLKLLARPAKDMATDPNSAVMKGHYGLLLDALAQCLLVACEEVAAVEETAADAPWRDMRLGALEALRRCALFPAEVVGERVPAATLELVVEQYPIERLEERVGALYARSLAWLAAPDTWHEAKQTWNAVLNAEEIKVVDGVVDHIDEVKVQERAALRLQRVYRGWMGRKKHLSLRGLVAEFARLRVQVAVDHHDGYAEVEHDEREERSVIFAAFEEEWQTVISQKGTILVDRAKFDVELRERLRLRKDVLQRTEGFEAERVDLAARHAAVLAKQRELQQLELDAITEEMKDVDALEAREDGEWPDVSRERGPSRAGSEASGPLRQGLNRPQLTSRGGASLGDEFNTDYVRDLRRTADRKRDRLQQHHAANRLKLRQELSSEYEEVVAAQEARLAKVETDALKYRNMEVIELMEEQGRGFGLWGRRWWQNMGVELQQAQAWRTLSLRLTLEKLPITAEFAKRQVIYEEAPMRRELHAQCILERHWLERHLLEVAEEGERIRTRGEEAVLREADVLQPAWHYATKLRFAEGALAIARDLDEVAQRNALETHALEELDGLLRRSREGGVAEKREREAVREEEQQARFEVSGRIRRKIEQLKRQFDHGRATIGLKDTYDKESKHREVMLDTEDGEWEALIQDEPQSLYLAKCRMLRREAQEAEAREREAVSDTWAEQLMTYMQAFYDVALRISQIEREGVESATRALMEDEEVAFRAVVVNLCTTDRCLVDEIDGRNALIATERATYGEHDASFYDGFYHYQRLREEELEELARGLTVEEEDAAWVSVSTEVSRQLHDVLRETFREWLRQRETAVRAEVLGGELAGRFFLESLAFRGEQLLARVDENYSETDARAVVAVSEVDERNALALQAHVVALETVTRHDDHEAPLRLTYEYLSMYEAHERLMVRCHELEFYAEPAVREDVPPEELAERGLLAYQHWEGKTAIEHVEEREDMYAQEDVARRVAVTIEHDNFVVVREREVTERFRQLKVEFAAREEAHRNAVIHTELMARALLEQGRVIGMEPISREDVLRAEDAAWRAALLQLRDDVQAREREEYALYLVAPIRNGILEEEASSRDKVETVFTIALQGIAVSAVQRCVRVWKARATVLKQRRAAAELDQAEEFLERRYHNIEAATTLQALLSAVGSKRVWLKLRRERAMRSALRIQTHFRRYVAQRRSVKLLAARAAAHDARLLHEESSAHRIQRAYARYRAQIAAREYMFNIRRTRFFDYCATLIQSRWRGVAGRRVAAEVKRIFIFQNTRTIQTFARVQLARNICAAHRHAYIADACIHSFKSWVKVQCLRRLKAVKCLQRAFRVCMSKMLVAGMKVQLEERQERAMLDSEAAAIQKVWRGWLTRRTIRREMLQKQLLMQQQRVRNYAVSMRGLNRIGRGGLARTRLRVWIAQREAAALRIQKWRRMVVSKRKADYLRRLRDAGEARMVLLHCAATLQKHARGLAGRLAVRRLHQRRCDFEWLHAVSVAKLHDIVRGLNARVAMKARHAYRIRCAGVAQQIAAGKVSWLERERRLNIKRAEALERRRQAAIRTLQKAFRGWYRRKRSAAYTIQGLWLTERDRIRKTNEMRQLKKGVLRVAIRSLVLEEQREAMDVECQETRAMAALRGQFYEHPAVRFLAMVKSTAPLLPAVAQPLLAGEKQRRLSLEAAYVEGFIALSTRYREAGVATAKAAQQARNESIQHAEAVLRKRADHEALKAVRDVTLRIRRGFRMGFLIDRALLRQAEREERHELLETEATQWADDLAWFKVVFNKLYEIHMVGLQHRNMGKKPKTSAAHLVAKCGRRPVPTSHPVLHPTWDVASFNKHREKASTYQATAYTYKQPRRPHEVDVNHLYESIRENALSEVVVARLGGVLSESLEERRPGEASLVLDLTGVRLNPDSLTMIVLAFACNRTVAHLKLDDVGATDRVTDALVSVLQFNSTLTSVSMHDNPLLTEAFGNVVLHALREHPGSRELRALSLLGTAVPIPTQDAISKILHPAIPMLPLSKSLTLPPLTNAPLLADATDMAATYSGAMQQGQGPAGADRNMFPGRLVPIQAFFDHAAPDDNMIQ